MKRLWYILLMVSLAMQAQDYSRLAERTIMGTARYTGMSGAMTAIGGDPSAALDNPAGLGLYRRAEVMVTLGASFNATHLASPYQRNNYFTLPQASLVFSLPTANIDEKGVQFHNFMFSYQRLHSFRQKYGGVGNDRVSLGSLLNANNVDLDIPYCANYLNSNDELLLVESGYVDQYSFHWAMNISNKWYTGIGLQIQSYSLISDASYWEYFDEKNAEDQYMYNRNSSSLLLSGASFNLALGAIYRPVRWMRLGASIQTPSVGSLNTYTAGKFTALTDSLRVSQAPDDRFSDRNFHMPFKLSTSVAFQVSAYALLALQYDYTKYNYMNGFHSLRAGIEVIPVMGMYINAGYAFESTFNNHPSPAGMDPAFNRQDTYSFFPRNNHYASVALGYRGTHMIVQMAYQYRRQANILYAHELAPIYDTKPLDIHRIVLTIGWHQF